MKGAINLGNNYNHSRRRCRGCMRMACGRWENYPYYTGPCADAEGCCNRCDDDDRDDRRECRCRRRHGGRECCGMFLAWLPMALAANGIIPLVVNNPCRDSDFEVNSGLVTVERAGTYLATCNVRVPEGAALNTTVTLNVDDASQTSAITQVVSEGTGASAYSAQAIFDADEGATVAMRTSDAINIAEPSAQPLFSLSLVRLGD